MIFSQDVKVLVHTNPPAHSEDGDGVTPRNVGKTSHLDPAVCPTKLLCILSPPDLQGSNCNAFLILFYLIHGMESFLKKLTVPQLDKKFPAFYGTRRFITAVTSAPDTCLYPEPPCFVT